MSDSIEGGRPTKYREAYCNEVVECLAQGHSVTAFAGLIGVNPATVAEWQHQFPQFAEAVKLGRAKAVLYWEDKLKTLADTGNGNATAVIFGLKNRAASEWSDTTKQELSGAVKLEAVKRVIVRPDNPNA